MSSNSKEEVEGGTKKRKPQECWVTLPFPSKHLGKFSFSLALSLDIIYISIDPSVYPPIDQPICICAKISQWVCVFFLFWFWRPFLLLFLNSFSYFPPPSLSSFCFWWWRMSNWIIYQEGCEFEVGLFQAHVLSSFLHVVQHSDTLLSDNLQRNGTNWSVFKLWVYSK